MSNVSHTCHTRNQQPEVSHIRWTEIWDIESETMNSISFDFYLTVLLQVQTETAT